MMTMIVILALTKISATGLTRINNGMTDGKVGSIVDLNGQLQSGMNTTHGKSQSSHHAWRMHVPPGMNNVLNNLMICDDPMKRLHGLRHHHRSIMYERFDVALKERHLISLTNQKGSRMISPIYRLILNTLVTISHVTYMECQETKNRHHNVHHPTVHELVDVVNHEQVGGPSPLHTHVRRPWLQRQRLLYHEAQQVSACAKSNVTRQSS